MSLKPKIEHAPTPWSQDGCEITSTDGEMIIYDEGGHSVADAEFIVRAVNAHEDLLAVAYEAAKQMRELDAKRLTTSEIKFARMIEQAIAKAEGKL
jgi:hypothetical protein